MINIIFFQENFCNITHYGGSILLRLEDLENPQETDHLTMRLTDLCYFLLAIWPA